MARRFSEDELIATLFAPLAGAAALGLRDDAALLAGEREPLGGDDRRAGGGVHFFEDDPPGLIAKKALRVNLSDLAAKGAEPVGFLLALALPPDWTNDWLAAFAAGLGEDARAYRCPLARRRHGFDAGAADALHHRARRGAEGRFVARTSGQAGDAIFVSEPSATRRWGCALRRDEAFARRLSAQARDHLLERYLLPRPRLALAAALRLHASAAMDVSDGLVGDLGQTCARLETSARKSRSRACPFPTRRGRRSLSTQACWRSR